MLCTQKHGHDLGMVYGIRVTQYQAERAKAEEEAAAAAAAEAQVEFRYYIYIHTCSIHVICRYM